VGSHLVELGQNDGVGASCSADDTDLPDPRKTVPKMVELPERFPKPNLPNVEPAVTRAVFDEEPIARRTVELT
jgi:hypothetical protein